MKTWIYFFIIAGVILLVASGYKYANADYTIYSITAPGDSDGWAFDTNFTNGNMADDGIVANTRQLQFQSPSNSGEYGRIRYTLTGLTPGFDYRFTATSSEIRFGSAFGPSCRILVDGTEYEVGSCVDNTNILTAEFTASDSDAVLELRVQVSGFGAGINNQERFANILVEGIGDPPPDPPEPPLGGLNVIGVLQYLVAALPFILAVLAVLYYLLTWLIRIIKII